MIQARYNGSFQRSQGRGNPNLKPEIKTEAEFGTDLEFFNRFTINATYYTNETKDLLVDVPLNGSSTYGSIYDNYNTKQRDRDRI
jgi:outer membrane receptor for ferrienterochelin and colicin